jgi:hypothetical protein
MSAFMLAFATCTMPVARCAWRWTVADLVHGIIVAALCEIVTRPGMNMHSEYYVAKYLLANYDAGPYGRAIRQRTAYKLSQP